MWLVEQGEYDQSYISAAFTSEELANAYAQKKGGSVEEVALFDKVPEQVRLHVRIAEIYPDGTVERHEHSEEWDEPGPAPLGEHLMPWPGHTQGHCGVHVYVSGADAELVDEEFERHIAEVVPRMDGTCACGKTEPPYMTDWWKGPKEGPAGWGSQTSWAQDHGLAEPSHCSVTVKRGSTP